ncbi:hypothetical protein BG844_04730 [Couchioplanes caeruleus subsp. caeruleus]|uniref:Uncharacterized protein n=1 Tax=Couchioplanes caeruleus subsp. caeruleus TaxID=56427 RepID=A0A1K0FRJ1_9ACTN|nr:hypothetical protein BG844_04730 [Couchioplanes caeruleus subsp. caeruleus]
MTVRALWPMPGVPDQAVSTLSWGPHLAALVDAGRYEILPPAHVPDGGEAPIRARDQPAVGNAPARPDAEPPEDRPARRPRAR